jgi:tungstate transport system ATP-binding protein
VSASILPLEVDAVEYRVREHVLLDGVSFTLRLGPKSVILGPNGAGKSLLLRICHGLLWPTGGGVRYAGGASPAETRARQAMLFQRPVLLRRSAAANVAWALAVRGVPRAARRARVREVLEGTGLAALADRPARVLSGGEQHRLALARVWALRPELVFLDEPTSSLDPSATRAIEALIEKIHAEGAKVVLTTQDLAQARRLADEVLFLHRGRLLEVAPAERFFDEPATPEARAFLRGELLAG